MQVINLSGGYTDSHNILTYPDPEDTELSYMLYYIHYATKKYMHPEEIELKSRNFAQMQPDKRYAND